MYFLTGIPDVTYRPPIGDLFANFSQNWDTLSPALVLLYGTLFGFFVLAIVKKKFTDD